jgi:hypothetical protein
MSSPVKGAAAGVEDTGGPDVSGAKGSWLGIPGASMLVTVSGSGAGRCLLLALGLPVSSLPGRYPVESAVPQYPTNLPRGC